MNNFIHVHIPKNGGSSIEKTLEDYCLETNSYLNGKPFRDDTTYRQLKLNFGESLNKYHVFSIIRNPYMRALSIWKYNVKRNYDIIKLDVKTGLAATWARQSLIFNFNDFCEQYFAIGLPRSLPTHYENTQFHYIRDFDFTLPKDLHLLCLENIKNDIKILSRLAKIELQVYDINKSSYKKDPIKYYNQRSVEIIQAIYHDDFEFFGYSRRLEDLNKMPMLLLEERKNEE
jgi:hypothetical protein